MACFIPATRRQILARGICQVCCLLLTVLIIPHRLKELIKANHNGKGHYYIAEWYPAWFDWWGPTPYCTCQKLCGRLGTVLAAGISINMYMFHGGTTRGFMNGANFKDGTPYEPQISSYDYDAPLDEAGNATPKYMLFRKIIARHLPAGTKLPAVPSPKPTIAISNIRLTQSAGLTCTVNKTCFK